MAHSVILLPSMHTTYPAGLVWFRRDLRTHDHPALLHALSHCKQVFCVFVFDTDILNALPRADRRVEFIRESLVELDAQLRTLSGKVEAGLIVCHGQASEVIPRLAAELQVGAVYAAQDYEPQAITRDAAVEQQLRQQGQHWHTHKDHVIFERREVLTQSGKPYGVFTPYSKAWLALLETQPPAEYDCSAVWHRLAARPPHYCKAVPDLNTIAFSPTNLAQLALPTGMTGAQRLLDDFWQRMDAYDQNRNFPAIKGPSYLSVHLRFGTVSIRQLVRLAWQRKQSGSVGAAVWLGELIWRDFYFQVLANFPHVVHSAFKPEYDRISWEQGETAERLFAAWCQGATGYPLVDAAMAQLNQTGYMHNRLRMVTGSFLVKHLGIDWRWGERYFAEKLNDFDLSANNGGWQWVSSSGCDAQPYFRIFNPISQSEKFDADGKFIRRYIPALAPLSNQAIHAPWLMKPIERQASTLRLGTDYPHPIVEHASARQRTLERYQVVRQSEQASN